MGDAALKLPDGSVYKGALHPEYRPPKSRLIKFPHVVGSDCVDGPERTRELLIRADAVKEFWVRTARRSFPAFMQYCFCDYKTGLPFEQQWFHDEWSAAMDTQKRLLIVAPRNHGKTSQVVGRTIWELGRDPNLRIKIVCAADGRAKERLFEISQNILYNPRVKEVFPFLEPDDTAQWNVHKIHVKRTALHKDASVEAVGITSTATGGRCDILIPDDVVDRRNALAIPALRKQIKQSWLSDWTNLLDDDSRVWGICTLWHKDDLNHMLMENPVYKTLFYAIPSDFGSMWIERWSEEKLRYRHREIQSVEFNRGFRNQAVDLESKMVPLPIYRDLANDEEFQARVGHMHFIQSYDSAGDPGEKQKKAGNKEQDFSASCVIAVDAGKGKVYVIDAWNIRAGLNKMSALIHEEAMKYHPYRIVIEKVGLSALHSWVVNDWPELAPIVETETPGESKALRMLDVVPLMERGQVIFSSHLDPDRAIWAPGKGSLVHELDDFPFSPHDDMADAFSQALKKAKECFLDAWAPGVDNDRVIDFGIGSSEDGEKQTEYRY